jgi:steroid 5-alpha reductase family enzyme
LLVAVLICVVAVLGCWLVSVVTGNYSQVDRLWSIMPPVNYLWFAGAAGFRDARLDVMAGLAVLWGARLTFNFARKGGYRRGSEDYRWPVLRKRLGPVKFQLLNATFISPYQNFLLLLLALPAEVARRHPAPWSGLDTVAALGFVLFLCGETAADEQQWRFHQEKAAALGRGETVEPPFLTTGLFRFSRHPNFFCEQAMWWCMYLFAVTASGRWLGWALPGAVLLTLLFQGSTAFTESISLAKYPGYRDYQRQTSRLLPWFASR